MRLSSSLLALAVTLASVVGYASFSVAEDKAAEVKIADCKCPVSGKPCDETKLATLDGAKVYFCCDGCKAKFEKDSAPFTAKAHLQMVQTGQFGQKACPFSGGKTKDGTEVSIDGVKVAFCCNNCQAKAEKAGEDAVKLVFGAGFAKGFVKK
ncbi:MAG: hypothetical protein QM811_29820 [Pirellulales bacterium]